MQALAAFAALGQLVMSLLVGLRLLAIARRTRRLPELVLGTAQIGGAAIGYPLLVLAFLLAQHELPGSDGVLAAAIASTVTSIWMFYVFTWRVFRQREPWAAVLAVAAGAMLVFSASMAVHDVLRVGGILHTADAPRTWIVVFNTVAAIAYGWTAWESLTYYGRQRRQVAVGLGDPVVCNRFLLWGVLGVALGLSIAASIVLTLLGTNPASTPAGLATFGLTGGVAAVCLYLAFFPPAGYTRWLAGPEPAAA